MPVYEFECTTCGVVERMLSMADSQSACQCPQCGQNVRRIIGTAPRLSAMGRGGKLQAELVNERSQNDPVRGSEADALGELRNRQAGLSGGRHPAGCGCCQGASTRSVTKADGSRSFPGRRPWMISH